MKWTITVFILAVVCVGGLGFFVRRADRAKGAVHNSVPEPRLTDNVITPGGGGKEGMTVEQMKQMQDLREAFEDLKRNTSTPVTSQSDMLGLITVVTRTSMQVLITISLAAAALYLVISKKIAPKDKNWAYATLGTILGYWLKG